MGGYSSLGSLSGLSGSSLGSLLGSGLLTGTGTQSLLSGLGSSGSLSGLSSSLLGSLSGLSGSSLGSLSGLDSGTGLGSSAYNSSMGTLASTVLASGAQVSEDGQTVTMDKDSFSNLIQIMRIQMMMNAERNAGTISI